MRLLVDTNVFLEVLLAQERAKAAQQFLSKTDEHEFFISDFSLHSIGLVLFRHRQQDVFHRFLVDMFLRAGIGLVALSAEEMQAVVQIAQRFGLDFDDAYQYALAERYALTIVSFDTDFDRTEKGRWTPAQF